MMLAARAALSARCAIRTASMLSHARGMATLSWQEVEQLRAKEKVVVFDKVRRIFNTAAG